MSPAMNTILKVYNQMKLTPRQGEIELMLRILEDRARARAREMKETVPKHSGRTCDASTMLKLTPSLSPSPDSVPEWPKAESVTIHRAEGTKTRSFRTHARV